MYDEAASALMHAFWAERDRFGEPEPVNIFYLDHDPVLAACMHCDAHVVKMILETAQLLSTAHHVLGHVDQDWSLFVKDVELPRLETFTYTIVGQRVYGPTHVNHPCAVWVRESAGNYDWLWRLGMALLDEYKARYKRDHATRPVLWTLERKPSLPPGEQSEPPCAMPYECKVEVDGMWDAVASYRNYYNRAKQHLLKWSPPATQPTWVNLRMEADM
jgi:hypothetical protein